MTERRQAEEEVRLSEERYALALAGSNEGVFDWDLRTNLVYAPPHTQELLGLPLGQAWRTRAQWESQIEYYPGDYELMQAALEAHFAGLTPMYDHEVRIVLAGGDGAAGSPPAAGRASHRPRGKPMSEPTPKVLVVEDEAEIRRFVRLSLELDGFEVCEADGVQRGLIEAGTRRPDLVVLDLGLPDGDGVDLIRDLRTWSDIPILVLSARTTEEDKVGALDAGADDYLVKPFSVGELQARVRAHLRRRARSGVDGSMVIEFGDIKIDLARRTVERAGQALHLTPIEYRLLTHLTGHPHYVRTHRQLLNAVWGSSHSEDTQYLRVYMGQLRKKIEVDPSQPRHLSTETGIGYRFVP